MDSDLASIQDARDALTAAHAAQKRYATFPQEHVDRIVAAMVEAGANAAERLGQMACDETGFGRPESKTQKNLFATRTLAARMEGMKTAGIIRKTATVWEVATPMGVVAALVPSTNPTATALYKSILAAKARCAIVMSPHPRAANCTAEAVRIVAEAAVAAGAPEGLFHCLTRVTLAATDALMEHPLTSVILATGGGPMVRAAYSKGKPAYGVGSGNVPVYVDRSANLAKAAADILAGTSFDWGTLCSTERSVVADAPVKSKLLDALRAHGGHVCSPDETAKLRAIIKPQGVFNTDIVGQSPRRIAEMAGFSVPETAQALIAEVDTVGPAEPLSMETLSPILSFYTADGWEAGCERCLEILHFGGVGHTLALHATAERVIEQFALYKPAMRIVVNTVAALGSVGMTTDLFPAMTLGPGAVGGSITSDNVGPMHLVDVKRIAFEAHPLHDAAGERLGAAPRAASRPNPGRPGPAAPSPPPAPPTPARGAAPPASGSWMERIEERLLARAGNRAFEDGALHPATGNAAAHPSGTPARAANTGTRTPDTEMRRPDTGTRAPDTAPRASGPDPDAPAPVSLALSEAEIAALVRRFRA
ncbi:MAG TPA: aldehyde dehydrogenase family protein [Rubricoccaceae bacterium]